MHTITHALAGILIVLLFDITGIWAAVFILASILIDIDHIADGKIQLNPKHIVNPFAYRQANYHGVQKAIHIFHTFEFMMLLLIISQWFSALYIVWCAFAVHIALDAIGNIWNRNIQDKGGRDWIKYWFVTYYLHKSFSKSNS
ncbi:MAG TPA: hypothetical protein VK158_06810 [Acidobacteriota bacterium]|nr:hypothetical protein [Acidobacteriota bacterium]